MNKTLSILLVVVIILGVVGGAAWWFLRSSTSPSESMELEEDDGGGRELKLEDKPFVTLTPRADGHELHLTITNILSDAKSLEYELTYKNADNVTQGVPGTVKLKGEKTIERDLLLGSCSSGKCKYDEGVEKGMLVIKYRDGDGKLISKVSADFHLQKDTTQLTSSDGEFKLTLESKNMATAYYLVIGTFGLPSKAPGSVTAGPYGVFSKVSGKVAGTVELAGRIYVYSGGKWIEPGAGKTSSIGTFIGTSQ